MALIFNRKAVTIILFIPITIMATKQQLSPIAY